jgi:hypothetical protein
MVSIVDLLCLVFGVGIAAVLAVPPLYHGRHQLDWNRREAVTLSELSLAIRLGTTPSSGGAPLHINTQ